MNSFREKSIMLMLRQVLSHGKERKSWPEPSKLTERERNLKIKGEGICANPEMLETRKGNISELPSPTIPPNFHVNKEVWHLRRDFSAKQ